jgi:hypothetical protein
MGAGAHPAMLAVAPAWTIEHQPPLPTSFMHKWRGGRKKIDEDEEQREKEGEKMRKMK